MSKRGYVDIVSNKTNAVLYTGVTSDLKKRIWEHRESMIEGFTKKYNVKKLVYYEVFDSITAAITREKQIKGWIRNKKIALIDSSNREWNDLYEKII